MAKETGISLKIIIPTVIGCILTVGVSLVSLVRTLDREQVNDNKAAISRLWKKAARVDVLEARINTLEENQREMRRANRVSH
jgi:CHASE3 domain sensor protein